MSEMDPEALDLEPDPDDLAAIGPILDLETPEADALEQAYPVAGGLDDDYR
ncbi:MAG: hypothetical protein ABIM89_03095 [Mycobacteriales bacterium]